MRRATYRFLIALALCAARPVPAHEEPGHPPAPRASAAPVPSVARGLPRLTPPPPGVTQLRFGEFFAAPVGDRGLVPTPRLLSLDGKRVRILGFMVRHDRPPPGVFLLTPSPVQLHEAEYGLADDLPATTVRVFVPATRGKAVVYTPGLLLLTGTLRVGNREEADGRVSVVRLTLDTPVPAPAKRQVMKKGPGTTTARKPAPGAGANRSGNARR